MLKKLRRIRRAFIGKPTDANIVPDVELVLHGVSGYNVIRSFNEYFAVPQGEGEFILDKARSGGYSSCFMGNSIDQVLREISANAQPSLQSNKPTGAVHPELALEGFHGFNIIRCGDEFHAILQCEGAFVKEKLLAEEYSRSFSGGSLAEVQGAITAFYSSELDSAVPQTRPTSSSTGA
jgi:hypothetical protein